MTRDISCNHLRQITFISTLDSDTDHCTLVARSTACENVTTGGRTQKHCVKPSVVTVRATVCVIGPIPIFICPQRLSTVYPIPTFICPQRLSTVYPIPTFICPQRLSTDYPIPTFICPQRLSTDCPIPTFICPQRLNTDCPIPTCG